MLTIDVESQQELNRSKVWTTVREPVQYDERA